MALFGQDPENERTKILADIELKKIEANLPAKESTSKTIGKSAIPWIVLLVIVGVVASAFLPTETLPAVIGLVSTAAMALISMVAGITGTKEKEEKPELKIIESLIQRLDNKTPPMTVEVDKETVTVSKGDDSVTAKR